MKTFVVAAGLVLISSVSWAAGLVNPTSAVWTAPTTNTDGSPLTDLGGYNAYIATGATAPPFPGAGWVKTTIPAASPTPAPGSVVTFPLPVLVDGQKFLRVTAFDVAGNESVATATVPFLLDKLSPGAPSNVQMQP